MYRDFQSRLAQKHGIIQRKVLDNQVSLAGNPTDCIRIRYVKNDEGDIESRIVSKADIVQIIWPPLKEIPIRKLRKNLPDGKIDETLGKYQITSLTGIASEEDTNNSEKFKLYFEHGADITVGDLIVRVFLDPDVKEPIILAVKVDELLGTFGQTMLLWESAICNLDVEDVPDKLANVIGQMAERRLHINF